MRSSLNSSILFLFCFIFVSMSTAQNHGTGFVPVEGGRLYYVTAGKGKPLVILHGGPGLDHSYFLPQMEALAEKYQLIFYDQRACGRSDVDVDSSTINMNQFVDDLDSLRSWFRFDKINLLGHSFGGLLAMRYALKYPDRLHTLLLVNSTPSTSVWRDSSIHMLNKREDGDTRIRLTELTASDAFKRMEPAAMESFYRLFFKKSFFDQSKVNDLSLKFRDSFAETNRMMNYLYRDSSVVSYNLNDTLSGLKIPSLIISAEADIIHPLAVEELHRSLKRSEYVFMEGCGHFPFVEQPETFRRIIEKFLDKN